MQSGWLKQYYHQHADGKCERATRPPAAEDGADVSRRDFVKTGFVAGVATGLAAG